VYNTYGISYNHVCGRVIGYQYHSADAFRLELVPQTIEGPYVDGVSLTHGPPGTRQHIWSFAAGVVEMGHLTSYSFPLVVEDLLPPMWETTTFVRVGILGQYRPMYCMQVTHSAVS